MTHHAEIADADAHAIAEAYGKRIGARKDAAVHRPQVEIRHRRPFRRRSARIDVPRVKHDDEIPIGRMLSRILGMDDEQAHHAHRDLEHLVGVRVIHVGAGLEEVELVRHRAARRNLRLRQSADTVHAVRHAHAVPVDRRPLGEIVGHEDADALAFDRLDRGAGRSPVIAPAIDDHAGREFPLHGLGDKVELLDPVHHPPAQRTTVRGDDGRVPRAGRRRERRLGSRGRRSLRVPGHSRLRPAAALRWRLSGAGGTREQRGGPRDGGAAPQQVSACGHGCSPCGSGSDADGRRPPTSRSSSVRAVQYSFSALTYSRAALIWFWRARRRS